jgi:probable DNA repair protein
MRAETLTLSALCERLCQGEVPLVVTPNRRLARFIERRFDLWQAARGRAAWERAEVLPFDAWVAREWQQREERAARPSSLASRLAARVRWEEIVKQSLGDAGALMNLAGAARDAASAWKLAHAWRLFHALDTMPLAEDARRFIAWAREYRARCDAAHEADAAAVPDLLARQLAARPLAKPVLAVGFDLLTPQQHHLWRACENAATAVTLAGSPSARARRLEFTTERDERLACAAWARHHLRTNPQARLGIVAPDLESAGPALARALADVLSPARRLVAHLEVADPALVNFSLGAPLSATAMVRDALHLLAIACQPHARQPYAVLGALLRSPHVGGSEAEAAARARLDAALRALARHECALDELLDSASRSPQAARELAACADFVRRHSAAKVAARASAQRQTPEDWGKRFWSILQAWGFPGERPLDSRDHQTLAAFRDGLRSLSRVGSVKARLHCAEALAMVRAELDDTTFQPESAFDGDAPIEVVGVLESGGLMFDALWVTGLDEQHWPRPARAHPLLPADLLRNAGVPEASPHAAAALDARITDAWSQAAPEVTFSHARLADDMVDGEPPRAASSLTRQIALAEIGAGGLPAASPSLAERLAGDAGPGAWLTLADTPPPALPCATRIRNGASMLRDQAACAFRAFARHRLLAVSLEKPAVRPTAAERGILLHRVMQQLMGELGGHTRLADGDAGQRGAAIRRAVRNALDEAARRDPHAFTGHLESLETERLARIAREWLDVEHGRAPFEVVALEQTRDVVVGELAMRVKLDRLDALADGSRALIDYKTGDASPSRWLGPRPDEPQLPLYHATAEETVSVVAFARLKRGTAFGFSGICATEGLLPGARTIDRMRQTGAAPLGTWSELTAGWKSATERLARDFASGAPRLDPKRGSRTCAECDLHGLCRVTAVGAEEAEPSEAVDEDAPDG